MRRVLLCLVLLAACRKTAVVDETAGIHDTGSGWAPDAYDALRIPPSGAIARKWSGDPARKATRAREADCEVAKICDADGFAYRATNADGAKLFVTYNGELSVRRAEVTKDGTVRAFEPVFVPTLPYLLLEVEQATAAMNTRLEWRREPSRVYDAYPLYRRALQNEQDSSEAGRLLVSYVTAFGVRDGRLVRDTFHRAHPDAAKWRSSLLSNLCHSIRSTAPWGPPSPFYREHVDLMHVRELQRFYAELIADESSPEVLTNAVSCFTPRDAFAPVAARRAVSKIVRSACAAHDDAASGARNLYQSYGSAPFDKEMRGYLRDAAYGCADGPYKQRLIAHFDTTDAERQRDSSSPW